MAKKDYQNWDKKELIKEINQLRKRKKYGLVWEDKPEDVVEQCKTKLPVLEEVKNKEIITDLNKPMNLLIEGDNYHALSVLNYTHKGKIDVIYIDPPYNTGAKNWKYNNNYVDKEDAYRHSKFASFLYHRLKIARPLLKKTGIIVCAIDDFEVHNVRHILDELFGDENRLGSIVVVHNPGGRQDERFFPTAHEYMLVYGVDASKIKIGRLDASHEKISEFKFEDSFGAYKLREFRRSGANSRKQERPNLWYPIFIHPNSLDISIEKKNKYDKVLPVDKDGIERVWRWSAKTLMDKKDDYIEVKKIDNGYRLYVKERVIDNTGDKPKTFWFKPEYSATNGTAILKKIFFDRTDKIFDFPKSPYLIRDILKITAGNSNSIVLDFFAGSGTTGHAVMMINKEDNGNRQFILTTNNELNGQEKILREKGLSEKEISKYGICQAVTYPRIQRVIKGYSDIISLPANLKYFKTSFVPADPTDKNKTALTKKAADMLCVKEDTFEEVKSNKQYKIFRNKKRFTGIIFDHQSIGDFKKEIAKMDGKFSVYIFSLGDDTFDEEFEDLKKKVKLSPIPEAILRVYRRIFK